MQHIPQIHILNFNHEYLKTPRSHVTTIVLPCCCHAALLLPPLPLCCRRRHHAATPLPPHCYHCYAVAAAALHLRRRVATKLPQPPLPPCHFHHRCHCQAAAATAKLLPLLLSTLWDRFDDEKEFCKMIDIDFFQLSWLFWPGVEFSHGGMLSIFDTLVYLSLNYTHL